MAESSFWVPGCSVVPEWMGNPPLEFVDRGGAFSDVNGARRAFGGFFRIAPNHSNWFHAPIPTPVIIEGRRAGIRRVLALFRVDGGKLDHVLAFDGGRNILDRSGLNVA